jgi:hypothetical protein
MGNYSASIVRLRGINPHPNAQKLQCVPIHGNNVIVGLDAKEDDLGIYFPVESQISEIFAEKNDLIRRKDENGKPAGGMLAPNRRVRAITLRGEKSEGLWLPIDSLFKITPDNIQAIKGLMEGAEFEEFAGVPICKKYVVPVQGKPSLKSPRESAKPRESRIIDGQFRFHNDTAQLGKNIHKINPGDLIALTWKMHGTSAIAANVLTKKKYSLAERVFLKIFAFFGVKITLSAIYDYIYASRRVIKNEFEQDKQHYYKYDLWTEVGEEKFKGKLQAGETVYYEIVGYLKDGAMIQKGFDYGCDSGGFLSAPRYKVYVYRITKTAPDGSVIELQWNQVKERCAQIGVESTPEIYYGRAWVVASAFDEVNRDDRNFDERFINVLKQMYVRDQDSVFCRNQVPEEGICVRVEGLEPKIYKLKSFRFLEGETKALDRGESDIESQQSAECQI